MSNRILKHFWTNEIKHKLLNKFNFKSIADLKRSETLKTMKNMKANEI